MDKHVLKFGNLYMDILNESGRISEEDSEILSKAKETYNAEPTDENANNLRNVMRDVSKKS